MDRRAYPRGRHEASFLVSPESNMGNLVEQFEAGLRVPRSECYCQCHRPNGIR
jgi:hypothetical protein